MTSIQKEKQHSESPHTTQAFIVGFWGVRYQVKDVQRAITFYTQTLGLVVLQKRWEYGNPRPGSIPRASFLTESEEFIEE